MPISLESFEIGEKLGRGRFGHVFRIERKEDKKAFALKVLVKSEISEVNIIQQLLKEVEIQKSIRHQYIIRLVGASQDTKRIYLFLELAEHGTLYQYLKKLGKFPEMITGKYIRQLLNALVYMHTKNIIHRDIKPENLLVSSSGNLKLADFGWCTEVDADVGRMTICGTPEYLAPEMISHQRHGNAVDSWTCGVLCYEFLSGQSPFLGMDSSDTYSRILRGQFKCPEFFSSGVSAFISVALRVDPSKRYNAGELYLHPWVQDQSEEGKSILEYDCEMQEASRQVEGVMECKTEPDDFMDSLLKGDP